MKTAGDGWALTHGDCIEGMARDLDDDSIDLSVYSPPFISLFVYSASERDVGNCATADEFVEHMGFVIRELLRVTKPGRHTCVHVADVTSTKQHHGVIGLIDLPGMMVEAYTRAGWIFHGRICIDKDPQAQAIRTKSKALLFVQLKKDASWLRPALADQILVFRKPGDNAVPVHPDINNEDWIQWARPVWYGVRESDTLNVAVARENDDERHICPLQLGTIERCIRLWSNPGETILSPFSGIGSEGYEAIRLGRKFVGYELKESYARVACSNLRDAEHARDQGSLFQEASS